MMEKCIATIKTGPRKGKKCGAVKKVIYIVNGKEIPHCNRHRMKENEDVNILSENLNNNLKIEENILEKEDGEDSETDKFDGQHILDDLDKQLDKLFSNYGL